MDSFILLCKLSEKGFHNPGSVVLELVRCVVRLLSSRSDLLEAPGATRPCLRHTVMAGTGAQGVNSVTDEC